MQNGGRVVTLSIATSESWKDRNSGERKQRTEWHRVVIFNEGLGEIVEKYLTKGAKVFIEGALRTRKWQDQSGADRYSTEIHVTQYNGTLTSLDARKDDARAPPNSMQNVSKRVATMALRRSSTTRSRSGRAGSRWAATHDLLKIAR